MIALISCLTIMHVQFLMYLISGQAGFELECICLDMISLFSNYYFVVVYL